MLNEKVSKPLTALAMVLLNVAFGNIAEQYKLPNDN
jgi:hypothetical protein